MLIENSFHVTAIDDPDHCASVIARNFVLNLNPGDTSCAATITEVRTVPNFAMTLDQVEPAQAMPGNQGSATDLKAAADATLAAGDLIARWWVNYSGSGVGLRGGTFSYNTLADHFLFTVAGVQWTSDLAVSGSMDWEYNTGQVIAILTVVGTAGESGEITAVWNDRQPHSTAMLSGQIGGRAIAARMYAP